MPDLHTGAIPQSGKSRQGDVKNARGGKKASGNGLFPLGTGLIVDI
jgi:hypothetical protein